ncbi:DUF1376 domain-containing protein [Falsochrobactrum sp. TDYN1]|uniref:DUF1376 domain-containing protein n=1 Tax=Falsochrobactrum tianjinense TaxID=2706015 RepID=A0A949PPS4_9HYPH|nr:DUF1376 domain-containing protein [Falsochrobactrum sp. TDYN1]MBV2144424.1 DUF1376 domain-containing protein [Falsochrobactrum sp. TDYN1]
MINLPWMQIYVGDELSEASGLSAEEYGAHMFLRLHQWRHGELPSDEERLRRIAHVDADRWMAVSEVLAPLYDYLWVHKRTAEVREASEIKHKNLSENGKKGGRPRKTAKADEKPSFNSAYDRPKADEKQSQSQPQSHSDLQSASKSQPTPNHGALDGERLASTREGERSAQSKSAVASDPDLNHPKKKKGEASAIPQVKDLAEAEAWLQSKDVFPGDVEYLAKKMVNGDLYIEDIERSAA